ncbi:hemolysin family protein [Pradoshia sp.]
MDIITFTNLLLLIILLIMTAFFVGAEFAVVKLRMSRIDQLISEGNKKAITAKKVASDLDYYLSACQLGITITALGLGALGKPAVERILYPVFDFLNISDTLSSALSYAIAFILVTFLHVVLGEMAPKTLAIQYAERMSLLLSPPLYWFGKIMSPFIWSLNGTSRLFLRLFGVKPAGHEDTYSEEELKIIMAQSFQGGEIDKTELSYMENIFSFDERVAKDIMVPRTEMVTLDKDMDYKTIISILDENNYTRYPVVEDGDKDRVVGILNVKRMLTQIVANRDSKPADFVRELPFVLETTPIQDALLTMQREQVHMVLVIDEYGGTAGILSLEDVLEEIVGEIRDEFDEEEEADIQVIGDNQYLLNGRVLLDEIEDRFGLTFEDSDDIDTIAGWILQNIEEIQEGIEVKHGEYVWVVEKMENHSIKQVTLRKL